MFRIRHMVETDIRCVDSIECQTLSPWSIASIRSELKNVQSIVLVAQHKDSSKLPTVMGWCAARSIAAEAELLKISVHRDFRQNGIGRALLTHLISMLRYKRVGEIFLEVRSQNLAALKFYLKSGFFKVGERKNYYAHPEDSALILRCDINARDAL